MVDVPTPRMLVLDLDGTTLTAEGTLTERDRLAARALQERGVHVTIATGRLFTGTQWVAHALGVRGSVAVMNGSELVDADSGQVRKGRYLTPAERQTIRRACADGGLSTFLFGSRRIHLGRADERHRNYLGIWTEKLVWHEDVFRTPEWEVARDIVAVCAIGEHVRVEQVCAALMGEVPETLAGEAFDTWTGERFLVLRHVDEDKGTALGRLAAERGCRVEECVAVGDWLNDLPMLRVAGRAFAMRGAVDEVQEAAGEVLDAVRGKGGAVAEVAARVWGVEV